MNIIVLSKDLNLNVTGGQIVNRRIYDLLEAKGHKLAFCQQIHPVKTNWNYLFSLLFHFREYTKYDKIIIDSSSFPKACLFVTLANLLGKKNKLITTLHHYIHCNMGGMKGKLYKFLELLFVRQCGMVIIFSPFVLDQSESFIHNSKLFYVGLPFNKKEHPFQICQEGELLYVGTIENRKGISYLIDALTQLNDEIKSKIHLNIVGKVIDQNYYNSLKIRIKKAGMRDKIIFKGRVSEKELDKLYNQAKLFVFPSLYEGFGMVLIEAMGYGLPVVCFDNSAMPYTVKNEKNGIVVQNKNVKDFADAIERIIDNNALYVRLSIGAKETYEAATSLDDFDNAVLKVFQET